MYQTIKYRWHQLPISRQLLVLVNSVLLGLVVIFLVIDYRVRTARRLHEKQIALTEEAKTMYESLLVVEQHGTDAIQDLVDNVCARMNSNDSPGHHIAALWNDRSFQARSHGHNSAEMLSAMQGAVTTKSLAGDPVHDIVVGLFSGPAGTVYVSEKRSSVVEATRESLVIQMIAIIALGAISALVVNAVLRQLIAKPIQGFVSALQNVAKGNLSVIARTRSCKELSFLAEQINSMTRSLDEADRDRRFSMVKAREIQQHLRPTYQDLERLDVAELFEPAEDVGGDYFDVIPLGQGRTLLCLADVVGHGVPAAMAATLIKAFVVEASKQSQCPAQILNYVNRRYSEIMVPGYFATMVILVIDGLQQRLTYANAGHEPPFLQRPDGTINRLGGGDIILGVDEDVNYQAEHASFSSASKLVILSDGVTETMNGEDEQFGTDRVIALLDESCKSRVNEVVRRFNEELTKFRDGTLAFDDTTLLVVQIS